MQTSYWKQSKSSKKGQQQVQRRDWSKQKRSEENLQMKKPAFKQIRLCQAEMFP